MKVNLFCIVICLFLASCGILNNSQKTASAHTNPPSTNKKNTRIVYNPETGVYDTITIVTNDPKVDHKTDEHPVPPKPNKNNFPTKNDSSKESIKISYRVAFLLPFQENEYQLNSNTIPETSTWALDYYLGAKLALDQLNTEGINLVIDVYDTEGSETKTKFILDKPELKKCNLIIGEYRKQNEAMIAEFGKNNKIFVLSPHATQAEITSNNPYYLQAQPSLKSHMQAILDDAIKHGATKENILILARNNSTETTAVDFLQQYYKILKKNKNELLKVMLLDDNSSQINSNELKPYLDNENNFFIIPSWSNENYLNTLLRKIDYQKGKSNATVYGLYQWLDFDKISIDLAERLNWKISSNYYIDDNAFDVVKFKNDFYNKYNTIPSETAYRGYDQTYFIAKKMNTYGLNFNQYLSNEKEHYLHSIFDFKKEFKSVGNLENSFNFDFYENKHVYILSFDQYRFVPQD
ncbi:MAG: amino acid ABC transporter substrate-binding protein [Saprospiraceae bacterium]|nr:amino acid ABC transporter substrate-binding protein [Saprospiraceae bacterium]